MSSKVSRTGHGFAFAMAAGMAAVFAIVGSKQGLAQMAPTGNTPNTTSIQRGSEKANELREPSFQTREERLQAKPLDWNSTIGTPKPLGLSSAEPESSAGGAPNPNADEEAVKLHPNEWK